MLVKEVKLELEATSGSRRPHPDLASKWGSLSSSNWKFWLEVQAGMRKLVPHPGPKQRPQSKREGRGRQTIAQRDT